MIQTTKRMKKIVSKFLLLGYLCFPFAYSMPDKEDKTKDKKSTEVKTISKQAKDQHTKEGNSKNIIKHLPTDCLFVIFQYYLDAKDEENFIDNYTKFMRISKNFQAACKKYTESTIIDRWLTIDPYLKNEDSKNKLKKLVNLVRPNNIFISHSNITDCPELISNTIKKIKVLNFMYNMEETSKNEFFYLKEVFKENIKTKIKSLDGNEITIEIESISLNFNSYLDGCCKYLIQFIEFCSENKIKILKYSKKPESTSATSKVRLRVKSIKDEALNKLKEAFDKHEVNLVTDELCLCFKDKVEFESKIQMAGKVFILFNEAKTIEFQFENASNLGVVQSRFFNFFEVSEIEFNNSGEGKFVFKPKNRSKIIKELTKRFAND